MSKAGKKKPAVAVEELASRTNKRTGLAVSLVKDRRADPSYLVYVDNGKQKLLMWWGSEEQDALAAHAEIAAKWCRP